MPRRIVGLGLIVALALLLGQVSGTAPVGRAQQAGLVELSLGLVGGAFNCGGPANPETCTVPLDSQFTLAVEIDTVPDPGYISYDLQVTHPGLFSKDVRNVAPDFAALPTQGIGTESFRAGGVTSLEPPVPPTTYSGTLVEADFECPSQPSASIIAVPVPVTDIRDENNEAIPILTVAHEDLKAADVLPVSCVDPLDFDEDGDGCTAGQELGANPSAGGRRDPTNPWDYFNPSRDLLNRVDDILLGIAQFGIDEGQPGYTEDTDRTLLGPDPWNLGPPNGEQRVDDIIHIINQFGHDCV